MRSRRLRGNDEATPSLVRGGAFKAEFRGVRSLGPGIAQLPVLAWSWGMSSSGGRIRRWGQEEDEEEDADATEKPLSINTQDLSCTSYFERTSVRTAINSISQGSKVSSFKLIAFTVVDLRKESELTPDSETDRDKLIDQGLCRMDAYMIIESSGPCMISSCSMGGSGGEDFLTLNISVSCGTGFHIHYANPFGRDLQVNRDATAGLPLGCSVMARRKTHDEFSDDQFVEFLLENWSFANHKFWPKEFQLAVKTFLLVRIRNNYAAFLNKDVVAKIVSTISESYLPSGVLPPSCSPFRHVKY